MTWSYIPNIDRGPYVRYSTVPSRNLHIRLTCGSRPSILIQLNHSPPVWDFQPSVFLRRTAWRIDLSINDIISPYVHILSTTHCLLRFRFSSVHVKHAAQILSGKGAQPVSCLILHGTEESPGIWQFWHVHTPASKHHVTPLAILSLGQYTVPKWQAARPRKLLCRRLELGQKKWSGWDFWEGKRMETY